MCLRLNNVAPNDLEIIKIHNELYIKGSKEFRIDYLGDNMEDLEKKIEMLDFNGRLYSFLRNYFYKIAKLYENLIILYDPCVQKVEINCGDSRQLFNLELGFHSKYINNNSNHVFKQHSYYTCMDTTHVITVPILINVSEVQLYGENNELVSKEVIIPNPDIVKEYFNENRILYSYETFYEKIKNYK